MKVAMIGTGFIVSKALECLNDLPIDVVSIYARHNVEKANQLKEQYHIDHVYTNYDELLDTCDCDFVYIGLVNTAHYEYVKKALEKNKHVIVEKPFCINADQTKEIIELANKKHLYVFEAVRPLHTPNWKQLKKDIQKIGNIRCIQCNYSQYSSRYDKYKKHEVLPALDPKYYGGALFDINIYNLNFVVSLFGKPDDVHYQANLGFNGVDTSGTVTLTYPSFYALCTGAKDADSDPFAYIQGDNGYIRVNGGASRIDSYTIYERNKDPQVVGLNTETNWMAHEFLDFKKMFESNDEKRMKEYLMISTHVMETVDAALKTIPYGQRKDVD